MTKRHSPKDTNPAQRIAADLSRDPTAVAEQLFRIEHVAERTGLTKRTLRYYEERGLLDPPTRTEGNYRLYTVAEIEHIKRVERMRELLGASLAEIKEMVDGEEARQAFKDEWARNPDSTARLDLLDRGEAVVRRQLEVVRVRLTDLHELESALITKQLRYLQRRDELKAQTGEPRGSIATDLSSN